MSSDDFEFDNVSSMTRNREIEGKTGTELGLPEGQTLIVLAASDANPKWRARSSEITRKLTQMRNARATNEALRSYLAGVYAECLIIDWRDVTSKGVPVPFSVEACTAFLRCVSDAYEAVDSMVYDTRNFRGARVLAVVDEAKN